MTRLVFVLLVSQQVYGLRRAPLPFEVARATVQREGLKTTSEWRHWWSNNRRRWKNTPFFLPESPEKEYDADWQSWEDWFGIPLPYEEARKRASQLGVVSQEHWWAYTREHASELLGLRIPSRPHIYYASDWRGYDEWLGLPETGPLVFPRHYFDCEHEECDNDPFADP